MAGCVGDDELALWGGEIAVGNVDRDALLALRLQSVDEQRQVEIFAGGAASLAVAREPCQLIVVDELGVVEETADQRALAVVDTAAGQEAQQILLLLGSKQIRDRLWGRSSRSPARSSRAIRNNLLASSFPSSWIDPGRSRDLGARTAVSSSAPR